MLDELEVLEELIITTNKRSSKATVSPHELEELGKIVVLLHNHLVKKDDYKTSYTLQNSYSPTQKVGRKKSKEEYRQNYEFAIEVLNIILGHHGVGRQSTATQKGQSGATPIPRKIKAVISYMIYRAMEIAEELGYSLDEADKLVNQRAFLETELGLQKKKIERWGIRPKQYYHVTHYEQPNSPIHYKGAKTGDYGYAIRQLVYQAGKYHVFADIFGGGGNASLAVIPIDNKNYFYNEINPLVYNTVDVLKHDSSYEELIGLYEEFRDEVQDKKGKSQLLEGYLKNFISKDETIEEHIDMLFGKAYHKARKSEKQNAIEHVGDIKPEEIEMELYEIDAVIHKYNRELNVYKRGCISRGEVDKNGNPVVWLDGEECKIEDLKCLYPSGYICRIKYFNEKVQKMMRILDIGERGHHVVFDDGQLPQNLTERKYLEHLRTLKKPVEYAEYCRSHGITEPYDINLHTPQQKKIRAAEMAELERYRVCDIAPRFDFTHNAMLGYWYLFKEIYGNCVASKGAMINPGNKVFYAFIYMFLRFFAYHNQDIDDETQVLYADEPGDSGTRYKSMRDMYKFLGQPFRDELEAFHKRFRHIGLSDMDFGSFIDDVANNVQKYKPKYKAGGKPQPYSVVFYSDSPYLETGGYEMEDSVGNKSGGFGWQDMGILINKLVGSGQKFIFSCRACINNKKSSVSKAGNKVLRDKLFNVFDKGAKKAGIKLSVLAIEEKGKDLVKCLKTSAVIEIMICNFEIRSFSNTGKSSKTKFKVYDFDTFMQIFLNNAIL